SSTLQHGMSEGKLNNIYKVMSVATGSTASAIATILAMDGFTVNMLIDFLYKRFHNYVQTYPFTRPMVGELHNNDFLDFVARGEQINQTGKVAGVEIDLDPLKSNPELNSPEKYAYPFCAITVRATALFRFLDMPCLLAPEPPSITGMINACALNPDKPSAPIEMCKNCATKRIMPTKCNYCRAKDLKL
ncbi:MAG: DUF2193 family protein, partial [Methanosarcinales archaeon]